MPPSIRDEMSHELHRWGYMTQAQLHTRITRMRKIDKMICCYAVATERGNVALRGAVEAQMMRHHGGAPRDFTTAIQHALDQYRYLMTDNRLGNRHPATNRWETESGRWRSTTPNAQVVNRDEDDVPGSIRRALNRSPRFDGDGNTILTNAKGEEVLGMRADGVPPPPPDPPMLTVAEEIALDLAAKENVVKVDADEAKISSVRRIRFKGKDAPALPEGWDQPELLH